MALAFLLIAVFVFFFLAFEIICLVKRLYCGGENWFCRLIHMIECRSCKEACDNHLKIIFRAFLIATSVTVIVWLLRDFIR